MRLDIGRAARPGEGAAGELGAPALELVGSIGSGELEARRAVADRQHRLVFAHHRGAAIGHDLGVAAAGHDARPGLAVVLPAALDAILAGLLDVDRSVGGDDARQLVAQRLVRDVEEQLAPFQAQDGDAVRAIARESETFEYDPGLGVEIEAIAVGERDLQARARADAHQIAGEQRLVGFERLADALAGRGGRGAALEGAQEGVARSGVGDRRALLLGVAAVGRSGRPADGAGGVARRREQQSRDEGPGEAVRCR